jgi:hypothetical protein
MLVGAALVAPSGTNELPFEIHRSHLNAPEASESLLMDKTPMLRGTGSLPAIASGEGWGPARGFAENWGVL